MDGSFFLDLTNYQLVPPFAGVSQTVATIPGATYSLSFDLGSSTFWGRPDSITASAAGALQTFTSPTSGGNNDWQSVLMQFVASSTTTTVLLQGASGFNYIGLDNVDVEFVSGPGPRPIPEPATLALLGFGLASLAVARRRKQ